MFAIFMAISILAAPLQPGAPAPQLTFVDIEGRPGGTSRYTGWTTVYSFAGRESSDRVMAWQRNVGISIAKRHPSLRIVYINFADLTIVPNLFRKVVTPVLKHMNSSAMEELAETYQDEGVYLNRERTDFYLVPDWSGDYMRLFGIPDTDRFHVWIAHAGQIKGYFVEGEDGLSSKYLDAFASIATEPVEAAALPITRPAE